MHQDPRVSPTPHSPLISTELLVGRRLPLTPLPKSPCDPSTSTTTTFLGLGLILQRSRDIRAYMCKVEETTPRNQIAAGTCHGHGGRQAREQLGVCTEDGLVEEDFPLFRR